MGTTADKLNYLIDTKTAIKEAIVAKGGVIEDGATFRSYADSVGAIKSGGFPNGTEWTQSECSTNSMRYSNISYANGIWYAIEYYIGGLYKSNDNGKTWANSYLFNSLTSDTYVFCKDGVTYLHSGGLNGVYRITSESELITTAEVKFSKIVFNDTITLGFSNSNGIYYSKDNMVTWQQTNVTAGINVLGNVIYKNGIWVAGSFSTNPGIYYSEDGMTWEHPINTDIRDVVYSDGIWYALGNTNYRSSDGKNWNEDSNLNCSALVGYSANGVLAVGSTSGIWYSIDKGDTWNQSNVTEDSVSVLRYANGIWLAGVNKKNIWYSTNNAATWKQASGIDYRSVVDIVASNGIWIASCNSTTSGALYYSVTWEPSA